MNKKEKGSRGEDVAVLYLSQHGFSVLERNLKEGAGEVDIVAHKDGVLHFVEVKSSFVKEGIGTEGWRAEERITRKKIHSIANVASLYLERKGEIDREWCIDVLVVRFFASGEWNIEEIPNVIL